MSAKQEVFTVHLNESDCIVIAEALAWLSAHGCSRPMVLERLGLMFTALAPRKP